MNINIVSKINKNMVKSIAIKHNLVYDLKIAIAIKKASINMYNISN